MRTNEEFKAEVLSRSRKKIKERKRNLKILVSCCVPLVLCIVLLIPLNGMTKNGMAADNSLRGESMEDLFDGVVGSTKEESIIDSEDEGEASLEMGSEKKEIISLSVDYYKSGESIVKTTDNELAEKLLYELESARNANTGLYSYHLLLEETAEGNRFSIAFSNGDEKEYILIENRLYVDNVLYEIKDDYVKSIEYIIENAGWCSST